MILTRVIPVLLIKDGGLYKGEKFKNHRYVGDPINTVKIFNDKQVDELVLLDIGASLNGTAIDYKLIEKIAGEAFMPLAYGGGVFSLEQAKKIISLGIEKIIINTAAIENPILINKLVEVLGSQSVVFSLDVKKDLFGIKRAYSKAGTKKINESIIQLAKKMQKYGVGEIILNNIDLEGTGKGYDLALIKRLSEALDIPLIALGGAANVDNMIQAKKAGAHGLAAGTMFVFQGPLKGVLITYLSTEQINKIHGN